MPLRDAAAPGGGTAGRGGRGDPGFRPEDALVGRTTQLLLSPQELIEKLPALVPPPATRTDEAEDGSGHARPASGRHRLSWAKLLARVFRIDVRVCPDCSGRMRVIAALTEPASIRRFLQGMGLSWRAPRIAPVRPAPQAVFDYVT